MISNADNDCIKLEKIKYDIKIAIEKGIQDCDFISINFPENNLHKVDIKIISNSFRNFKTVKRQQMVYKVIGSLFDLIHIIKLTTITKDDLEV